MGAKTAGIIDYGMSGILVDVECQISKGLPTMVIVGIASKAVEESKERIRSAFINSDLPFPKKRLTINLAPADIPKDGTSLDLPIAVAILIASDLVKPTSTSVFIGELGLNGSIRPVRGIIGKLLKAKELGLVNCFVPAGNARQARSINGISVYPVNTLAEIYFHLAGITLISPANYQPLSQNTVLEASYIDFKDIAGQEMAKRALEIAAAGGHNVLLSGPPGTGKSMLAKAFRSILPAMSHEEMVEVTHLHSLSTINYESVISERPFRAPHHSASNTSIVGGGQNPRPGEISLSHRGVLYLDELPEFNRTAIEALRQPLENGSITIARARFTVEYPANFILIATANPCPCGNYGTNKQCTCTPSLIANYQRKMSGPILDRIDMFVDVSEVEHRQLLSLTASGSTSDEIRIKINNAREIQNNRFKHPGATNASMDNHQLKNLTKLSLPAQELLNTAGERLNLSARSYMRVLKVARTIADIEGSESVEVRHVSEALQYRRKALTALIT